MWDGVMRESDRLRRGERVDSGGLCDGERDYATGSETMRGA